MYKVYAIAPCTEQVTVLEFRSTDNAIRCCFFLSAEGYQIDQVTLPNGSKISGDQITETMLAGVSAARTLLKCG